MSTTEKLNQLLQKLDIDEDIMTLLNNERITSLRKLFNLTDSSLTDLEGKVSTAAGKSDLTYIDRLIKSHQHLQVNGNTPVYDNMDTDTIDKNIISYERYLQEKETTSVASLPSLNATSHSERTNHPRRTLTIFADLKMPQMPVTVKKMNAFKISFVNNSRSIKLAHMLEPTFTRPIEGEANYDVFLDDNSFIYSAIVKCVEEH